MFSVDARRRSAKSDPTGTLPIQRKWSRDLDARWATIKRMLPAVIKERSSPVSMISHSVLTGKGDPIAGFQGWLDEAFRQVILGMNGAWLLPYVRNASDAGAVHARRSVDGPTDAYDAFDPNQPRDKNGEWTANGGGGGAAADLTKSEHEALEPRWGSITDKKTRANLQSAVATYTGSEYDEINAELRKPNNDWTTGPYQRTIRRLNTVFETAGQKLPRDTKLYRGVSEHRWNDLKPGDVVTDPSFVSTAPDQKTASYFSGEKGKMLHLTVPKGTTVITPKFTKHVAMTGTDVDILGEGAENEVLLRRGTSFRVDRIDGKNVHATVLKQGYLDDGLVVLIRDDAPPPPMIDRTHLLQSLAIVELQGIVEATSQQLVRVFANGLLARKSPAALAGEMRNVVDSVGVRRGHLLVSFMTIKAFNSSALDGFRALGISRVGLVPERVPPVTRIVDAGKSKKGKVNVITAEDDRVCPECEEIAADGPYYIDEAEHLIPAHPRCRCAFVPADPKEREEVLGDAWSDKAREAALEARRKNAVRHMNTLPEIHGEERHFAPWGEGEKDYGPEISVRSAGFERSATPQVIRPGEKSTRQRVPLNKLVLHQGSVTKGLVHKYIHQSSHEPIDVVKIGEKYYAASGTHRSVAAKLRGDDDIEANVYIRKSRTKDSATHIASGVMITADDTGRTLFVRRSGNGDQSGTWAFPGGAVEPGETVEQAAARECREEIGYDPSADLEQAHRASTNDVDFTTYLHNTDREFRPHLNHEHDAYKWALVERAPEPLHPGVARTLDAMDHALRMRDENNFVESKHPRDKDGKFTHKAGGGESKAPTSAFDPEPAEAPLPKVAPPPEHPLQQHLKTVSGTSSERVALRKQMNSAKGTDLKYLQEKHNASFWKQHQDLTKKGKLDEAKEIAGKLDKYSKTYGISNPLKSQSAPSVVTTAAPVFGKAAPKSAMTTHASSAHAMKADLLALHGKNADVDEHAMPDHYEVSTSTLHAKEFAEIAKKYPDAELMKGMQSTYLVPKNSKPAAPLPTHQPEIDFASLKKVGEQKGSNPGGVYEDAHGQQFYVKSMSKERADNELLAAKLYSLTGSKTLQYVPVKSDGDTHYVATKFEKLDKDNVSKLSPSERKIAQGDFATHAWLANWDAAGTGGDNIGVKNGEVKTLDVGGALEYRAKGTPKGELFGTKVNEWDTLRQSGKNVDAAALYGDMTDAQLKESVGKLTSNVTAADIRNTVESVYGINAKSKALADKLIDRKTDLVQRAEALSGLKSAPSSIGNVKTKDQYDIDVLKSVNGWIPDPKQVADFNEQHGLDLSVAQLGALQSYIGSSYKGLNKELRKKDGQSLEIIKFAKVFDEALAKMPIHEGYTQRGVKDDVGFKIFQKYADNIGKVVTETQFTSAGIMSKLWGATTLHIQSKAARSLTMMNSEGGGEVVYRKGTHLYITKADPKTHEIWAEEV